MQVGVLAQSQLQDVFELAGPQHFSAAGARCRPGISKEPVDLAPLEAQQNFICPRIPGDDFHLRAEDRVDDDRKNVKVAGCSRRAHDQGLACKNILQCLHR